MQPASLSFTAQTVAKALPSSSFPTQGEGGKMNGWHDQIFSLACTVWVYSVGRVLDVPTTLAEIRLSLLPRFHSKQCCFFSLAQNHVEKQRKFFPASASSPLLFFLSFSLSVRLSLTHESLFTLFFPPEHTSFSLLFPAFYLLLFPCFFRGVPCCCCCFFSCFLHDCFFSCLPASKTLSFGPQTFDNPCRGVRECSNWHSWATSTAEGAGRILFRACKNGERADCFRPQFTEE